MYNDKRVTYLGIPKMVEDALKPRYLTYVSKFEATSCRAPVPESWFTRFSFVITTSFTIISFIRFVINKFFVLFMKLEKIQYANIGAHSDIVLKDHK